MGAWQKVNPLLGSAAFSLAVSSFFPALVCGIFSKRTNKWGATLRILAGPAVAFYYMSTPQPYAASSESVDYVRYPEAEDASAGRLSRTWTPNCSS